MTTDEQRPLPALQQTILDPATLNQLFLDLEQLTEILSVTGKARALKYSSEEGLSLSQAREHLQSGEIHGLQVRYRYQGEIWWDTLLASPQGVRLTRLRLSDALS